MILICNYCGRSYERTPYQAKTSRYCSDDCFRKKSYMLEPTPNEVQVLLTGIFGDGCLTKYKSAHHYRYATNCKFKEYILFKQSFLENLHYGSCNESLNKGYKRAKIFRFATQSHPAITEIAEDSIENNLNKLTDLGVALWFYDDGSLHHSKHFYNLNTHAFNRDVQQELFIPFFEERYDVDATLAYDRKADGRCFTYLRINRDDGAEIISDLLEQYPVKCYSYKRI